MNRNDWDAYFSTLIGDTGTRVPGLAVLAYAGGQEVYRFAAGARRFEGSRAWPMTADSRFRMASVSKMFTVFTLMQLVEAGKLSPSAGAGNRSEERRVGKECSEPCRSRWSPYH